MSVSDWVDESWAEGLFSERPSVRKSLPPRTRREVVHVEVDGRAGKGIALPAVLINQGGPFKVERLVADDDWVRPGWGTEIASAHVGADSVLRAGPVPTHAFARESIAEVARTVFLLKAQGRVALARRLGEYLERRVDRELAEERRVAQFRGEGEYAEYRVSEGSDADLEQLAAEGALGCKPEIDWPTWPVALALTFSVRFHHPCRWSAQIWGLRLRS